MSEHFQPRAEPGFSSSVATSMAGGGGMFKLLRSEYTSKVDIRKPEFDKKNPQPTVFRPFPCRSYSDPNNSFEPYRKDPGGRNFFGYWKQTLSVAWGVGNPATTWIVQPSLDSATFNPAASPLGILFRAVKNAVDRGKSRSKSWQVGPARAFEPDPRMLLQWDGLLEGGEGRGKTLSWPRQITFMQGCIPMLGGKHTYLEKTGMPGWEPNNPCIFLLTPGPGQQLLDAINAENPGFRGDPADFANRYVCGDVVGLDSGAYIVVWPKGSSADGMANVPVADPADMYRIGGQVQAKPAKQISNDDGIGFNLRVDKECMLLAPPGSSRGAVASFPLQEQKDSIRKRWLYWEDILWFPTANEQAQLLASIMPASMLVYAFEGEHSEWLTEDVRRRARVECQAEMAPPVAPYGTSPLPTGAPQLFGYPQPAVHGQLVQGHPAAPGTAPSQAVPLTQGPGAAGYQPLPSSDASWRGVLAPLVEFPPAQEQAGGPMQPNWGASLDPSVPSVPGGLDKAIAAVAADAAAMMQLPSFANPGGHVVADPGSEQAGEVVSISPEELARQLQAMHGG